MNKLLFLPEEMAKITNGIWENLNNNNLIISDFHYMYSYLNENDCFVVTSSNWPNPNAYKPNEHKIQMAIKKGISAIIVDKNVPVKTDIPLLKVENSYFAIKKLAEYASKQTKAKKVLITGSYGKTGFKISLHHIAKNYKKSYVRLNSANYAASTYCNLASIKQNDELFLLEIPVARKDKILRRSKLINPDIGVITSIGHEGIERFKSIEKIIEYKLSIASGIKKDGKLLLPYDDRYYKKIEEEAKQYEHLNILTYGTNRSCNAHVLYKRFENFAWDVIARIEDRIVAYRVPFFEEYAVSSSLGVLLCAYHLGLDINKAAQEYYGCKNFKSSGLMYTVNLYDKNFYLYDQSNRGGIEGYESFFRTLQYIKPKNGGKKILVTSEFVDYKDGEMSNIDMPHFQKLIAASGIKVLFSVEKFSEHINVLEDKSIWKNHSIDFNNIKDEIIESIGNNDILSVKGIFESSLPQFIEYIKNLYGIKVEELINENTHLVYNELEYITKELDETYLSQLYDLQNRLEIDGDQRFSLKTFLRYIDEKHVYGIFQFENKEKLLGFCVLKQRGEWKEIFELAIDKAYQNKGLGSILLMNCIDLLIANRQNKIFLMVDAQNIRAFQLYEHIGFKIITEKKNYLKSGNNAYEMVFVW